MARHGISRPAETQHVHSLHMQPESVRGGDVTTDPDVAITAVGAGADVIRGQFRSATKRVDKGGGDFGPAGPKTHKECWKQPSPAP